MKLKFRKNKPPIKLLEKNELKHLATVKMKKAGRVVIEQETILKNVAFPSVNPICPLCKNLLSPDNIETVVLNGKRILCHKTCP